MIRVVLLFLDRLFPPTFGRITASVERAQARLATFAGAQYREANRQIVLAQEANKLADAAGIEARRAGRVRDKLRDLLA